MSETETIESTIASDAINETERFRNNIKSTINNINNKLNIYKGYINSYKNNLKLIDIYNSQNASLIEKDKYSKYNISTNQRKTFYRQQSIDILKIIYYVLICIYVIMYVVYLYTIITYRNTMSIIKKILLSILLLILPYVAPNIFVLLLNCIYGIINIVPKNINLYR